MAQVKAIYHNTDPQTGTVERRVEIGIDAWERVSGNISLPEESIRRNSNILADLMDNLENQGRGVYACAEVQGLAKLLDAIENPDFRKVIFSYSMNEETLEFEKPCPHCQAWLTGSDKLYRIAVFLLDQL